MYVPEHFRESRAQVLHRFIAQHPLATLVAPTRQGLIANHIPLLWMAATEGPGTLRGHIARANGLWRAVEGSASVLAIFTGAQHYVSPTWYPSRRADGKAVPTWNYAAVHVRGNIRFIEETGWLRGLVEALTEVHEGASAQRWHVDDAPASYIDTMLRSIVGFEIDITGIEGKFKGSQNRSMEDRSSVAVRLREHGFSASQLAELVPGVEAKP
ncbi:MAG TPA: FMN-binding negative transcriptional regulator [Steroidobacteraceae bacterium]|jgi:transcriptional regulator|nr:FMN-binding negative transcriptional regulator [Steroidobacteraceae bacterium]